jgi:hypothetical protein
MASARNIRAGAAYIELFVNDSRLVRGLQSASKKLKAFGEAITGWGEKLAAIGTAVAAPLIASAKVFAEMGDQMAKMSQRTGISVEALSELAYAAQVSGTDIETLETAIKRMQKVIIAAAEGSDGATQALADLGLTVEDLRGLSPDQQFKLIAERLSQIQSPAMKAALALKLFGKSGTQLLPLLTNGAAGIEALQEEARALGLTMSTEDAKAAAAFHESLETLWKVIKQGVFVIGSALAPLLRQVTEWVIRTVVSTTDWIKKNKDLVVTIFEVAVGIIAGGFALIALGVAITTVGTIIGALAGIIAGVGTALSVLGSIIAWLVTPIGLVTVAIAALGAYLIYASGAGGKALQWLGDRFTDLSDFATQSFQGISDALMAGDIALAAKILWLSLKVAWYTGVLALTKLWEGLKTASLKIIFDLWYGAQAAWEIGIASVSEVMLKLYYFVQGVWNRMATGAKNVWDEITTWVAKRIVDIQGAFDSSLDTEGMKQSLDEDTQARVNERNNAADAEAKRIDEERDTALKYAQEEHDARMAEIGQAADDKENQLDTDAQKKIDDTQAQLDQAKAEWQDAIAKARKEREISEQEGPDRIKPPPGLPDMLEGLGPTLEQTQKTIGVSGTFNAMEARGLGAGGVTDRIAKASEDTARNTKQMLQEIQLGGGEFE